MATQIIIGMEYQHYSGQKRQINYLQDGMISAVWAKLA